MADVDDDVIFERPDIATREDRQESSLTCKKLMLSVMLSLTFFGLGLCFAIPGPTLLDLEETTHTDSAHISMIFTSRSAGYLFGSLIGGVLFTYFNQACLLSLSTLATGIATMIAPFCQHLLPLAAMIMIQGISMGFLDIGGNVLVLEMYGRDNGPHLQSMHFAFGAGGFLAPLIAAPFLTQTSSLENSPENSTVNSFHGNISSGNGSNSSIQSNNSDTQIDGSHMKGHTTNMRVAYILISTFVIVVSVCFLLFNCCIRKSNSSSKSHEKSEYSIRQEKASFQIQMLILMFIFYFLYVGAEVTYGSLVSKFAVMMYGWSRQKAALINSVFWGSFALGRLCAIFLARCCDPSSMLIADLSISTVSFTMLAVLTKRNPLIPHVPNEALFWIFTATLGLGLASIFPTGLSWLERYMKVTGKSASVFVVGSALGEMILPALTGYLFSRLSPAYLTYVLAVVSLLSIVVYVFMANLACSVGERYSKLTNQEEGVELLKVADDDSVAGLSANCTNGHEGPDRKKKVTFLLSSESATSGAKDSGGKGSILRSKGLEKKD